VTATFVIRQRSRGCAEFGPSDLTYTDVVHACGRVVSTVRGTCDGEYVNARSERNYGSLDLAIVEAARRSQGWTRVEVAS
jgi:hypothetical protein